MSYYDDEEDLDIRVSRQHRSPPSPVHYVQARQGYFDGPVYLRPERGERTVVTTTRSRSRERRSTASSAAPPAAAGPVIIKNIVNNHDSSDEDDNRHMQVAVAHQHRSRSRDRRGSSPYMTREDYELERAREELRDLKLRQERDAHERRHVKDIREEQELRRAKEELEEIKRREGQRDEEKRIKSRLELEQLREQERAAAEKKRRDKEAEEAVERYKQKEAERREREKREKDEQEREYRHRLQEDLIKSGVDEKAIQAILDKKPVPGDKLPPGLPANVGRPTYTRMARKHLSFETLRIYQIEYDLDTDPDYILIKRWVPEWEQDALWKHTKLIRQQRTKVVLQIEDKKHHHHKEPAEPSFEWVRKKERRRSKSPSLLMYLAGAKPA